MKLFKTIGVTAAATLLAMPVFANDTEAALKAIYGKKIYDKAGYVLIRKTGRVSGRYGKKKLAGNWVMRDGLFCRTVSLGDSKKRTSCQELSLIDGGVVFTDKRGANGKPRVYTFNKP